MADVRVTGKQPGLAGRGIATVFFGVFLTVGLGIFGAVMPATLRVAATMVWSRVPCTMVESRLVLQGTPEGEVPGWHVSFAYVIDGQAYTGTRVRVNDAVGDLHDEMRRSQQLAPGTRTTCLVNPSDPTESVLLRDSFGVLFVPLFPLVFVAVGAGGIWLVWRRAKATPQGQPQALTARASSKAMGRRGGLIIGLFFGGLFFIVGLSLTWALFVRPVLSILGARNWSHLPCEIVSSEVVSHDSDDGTTYSVEITYRYAVGERQYVSNRYSFMGGSSSGYREKAEIVERHPPGSQALCFVNPDDPTDAVMERHWTGMMWFGLIPVLFALVGAGVLWGVLRSWRNSSRADTCVRDDAWLATRASGARYPAPALAGENSGPGGGPVELQPAASRRMKVIGSLLVALFWNGIVSIFVVNLFSDGWSGFSWFLALFLTPFVGVGVFLLGMAGRQILALSNPVPVLTASGAVVHPGGRLEVTWTMRGRVQALRQLTITLEGREEATYRRGTDTKTDREVFATLPLADVRDPADLAAGRAAIELPRRMMHSFAASHNKIVWLLRVKGDVPKWPDIDDEYLIHVAPQGGSHHA